MSETTKVAYSSNNSGGDWWLSDKDWYALEAAGWEVEWGRDQKYSFSKGAERWLGALATGATRTGLTLEQAIAEFETITGESAESEGCSCCGQPHYFYEVESTK